jgi:glyceraldehyde 3-phosphate dehydrogenase
VRIGINGFGRIGRQVYRIMHASKTKLEVAAANDLTDSKTMAHLLRYDSTYGKFEGRVEATDDTLVVDGQRFRYLAERDPSKIPWKDLGVDVVIEATGFFTEGAKARAHLDGGGARAVIISAPGKGVDATFTYGVNHQSFDPAKHQVISNASCTTGCLATVVKVLEDEFGIEHGLMNTIHSYTNDQRLLDLPHKDLRRARAAGLNIIPTTTGAARTVAQVIPALSGKLDGFSLRVPTPTVSVVDFTCTLKKKASVEQVNAAFKRAADGPMARVLGYTEEPLVSMDFKGDPRSAIIDGPSTMAVGPLLKVIAWYDNEWGYAARLADLTEYVAEKLG